MMAWNPWSFEFWELGFWIILITDTINCFLFIYGLLGFSFRGKKRYFFFFLYLLAAPLVFFREWNVSAYHFVWNLMIPLCFFEGSLIKKLQAFLLEYFAVHTVNLFLWGILVLFMPERLENPLFLEGLGALLGSAVWICLFALLHMGRKKFRAYFEALSWKLFFLLLLLFFSLLAVAGSAQQQLLQTAADYADREMFARQTLVFSVAALIVLLIVTVLLIYMVYSKSQLELTNRMQEKSLFLQKEYYEKRFLQEESMRSMRHDMKKHLLAIEALCQKGELTKVQSYVEEMTGRLEEGDLVQTGNVIGDYFINGLLRELGEQGITDCRVIGRFPEQMKLSDQELAVLLGNGLDNAKEALVQAPEEGRLEIEIKQWKGKLFLRIGNTVHPNMGKKRQLLETDKENAKQHGFGTGNMKRIVESHDGCIAWKLEENWFEVNMEV